MTPHSAPDVAELVRRLRERVQHIVGLDGRLHRDAIAAIEYLAAEFTLLREELYTVRKAVHASMDREECTDEKLEKAKAECAVLRAQKQALLDIIELMERVPTLTDAQLSELIANCKAAIAKDAP